MVRRGGVTMGARGETAAKGAPEPADSRGRAVGAGEGVRVDVERTAVRRLRTAGGDRGGRCRRSGAGEEGCAQEEDSGRSREEAARATPELNGLSVPAHGPL